MANHLSALGGVLPHLPGRRMKGDCPTVSIERVALKGQHRRDCQRLRADLAGDWRRARPLIARPRQGYRDCRGPDRGWLQKCWLRRASATAIVAPGPRRCLPIFRYTSTGAATTASQKPSSRPRSLKSAPNPLIGGALSSAIWDPACSRSMPPDPGVLAQLHSARAGHFEAFLDDGFFSFGDRVPPPD